LQLSKDSFEQIQGDDCAFATNHEVGKYSATLPTDPAAFRGLGMLWN
jgi:hypothetical protein